MMGVGLAMDAFSVSMANGLNEPNMNARKMLLIAGVFGVFIGKKFGTVLANKSQIFGGIVLIIIGIEIFVTGIF